MPREAMRTRSRRHDFDHAFLRGAAVCHSCRHRHRLIARSPQCTEHVGGQDRERGVVKQPECDPGCDVARIEPRLRESKRQQQHALQGAQRVRRQGHLGNGRIRVPIAASYPLGKAAQAHRRLDREHALGRMVLRVHRDRQRSAATAIARPRSGGISESLDAMAHQVLFIQGGGEGTHEEWDNKLVESLERELGPDYAVCYPRMPPEADPKYAGLEGHAQTAIRCARRRCHSHWPLDRWSEDDGVPGGAVTFFRHAGTILTP
jgi:Zinc-binding dehydrogenase